MSRGATPLLGTVLSDQGAGMSQSIASTLTRQREQDIQQAIADRDALTGAFQGVADAISKSQDRKELAKQKQADRDAQQAMQTQGDAAAMERAKLEASTQAARLAVEARNAELQNETTVAVTRINNDFTLLRDELATLGATEEEMAESLELKKEELRKNNTVKAATMVAERLNQAGVGTGGTVPGYTMPDGTPMDPPSAAAAYVGRLILPASLNEAAFKVVSGRATKALEEAVASVNADIARGMGRAGAAYKNMGKGGVPGSMVGSPLEQAAAGAGGAGETGGVFKSGLGRLAVTPGMLAFRGAKSLGLTDNDPESVRRLVLADGVVSSHVGDVMQQYAQATAGERKGSRPEIVGMGLASLADARVRRNMLVEAGADPQEIAPVDAQIKALRAGLVKQGVPNWEQETLFDQLSRAGRMTSAAVGAEGAAKAEAEGRPKGLAGLAQEMVYREMGRLQLDDLSPEKAWETLTPALADIVVNANQGATGDELRSRLDGLGTALTTEEKDAIIERVETYVVAPAKKREAALKAVQTAEREAGEAGIAVAESEAKKARGVRTRAGDRLQKAREEMDRRWDMLRDRQRQVIEQNQADLRALEAGAATSGGTGEVAGETVGRKGG